MCCVRLRFAGSLSARRFARPSGLRFLRRRFAWPRCDARTARWAVPGGDGEEGFAITQVLVWPLLWCAAPLRWPLFGTAFHSAVQPRLCSGRLRFAGRRTSARRFLRPRCDARVVRWAVPIPARSAPFCMRARLTLRASPRPRAQRAGLSRGVCRMGLAAAKRGVWRPAFFGLEGCSRRVKNDIM